MSKPIPPIFKYMSTSPHTLGKEQTVSKAMQMMKEHGFRHLPVLDAGKLIGIVSDRDLKLYQSLRGADPENDPIEQVLDRDVFTVRADSPLDNVASEMAEKKFGSAVVLDHDKVVGIFTTVDALRALAELLHTRMK